MKRCLVFFWKNNMIFFLMGCLWMCNACFWFSRACSPKVQPISWFCELWVQEEAAARIVFGKFVDHHERSYAQDLKVRKQARCLFIKFIFYPFCGFAELDCGAGKIISQSMFWTQEKFWERQHQFFSASDKLHTGMDQILGAYFDQLTVK